MSKLPRALSARSDRRSNAPGAVLDMAFFNVNGYISVITFVAAVAGLWY